MRLVGHQLVFFQNKTLQSFNCEILRVVDLLGEKVIFFDSLGTTEITRNFKLSDYIDVALLNNFPEQFESRTQKLPW